MSKSKLTSLSCFILTLLIINCNFSQNTGRFPRNSNKYERIDTNSITENSLVHHTVNIDLQDEDGPQGKQAASLKKPTNKVLIDPKQLNIFFEELKNIQPNQTKKGLDRIKNRIFRETWVSNWDKAAKRLKKEFPHIRPKSLKIVSCIMKLSDKNSEKSKKNSPEGIINQFTEEIKKASKKKKSSSLKEIILASIKDVNEPLSKVHENCKKEKKKIKLKKIYDALCAFEKMIDT